MTRTPARTRRRRRVVLVAASAALAVGGIAAAGGFSDVPREELPVFAAGETYDNGLYAVTLRSAAVVDADPFTDLPLERPAIVAEVDLRYRGDESARFPERWLRPLDAGITERSASTSASVRDARDGARNPPVQPGLPLRAVYSWPLPDASSLRPGDPVEVGVYERYERSEVPIEGVTTDAVLVGVFRTAGR